MIRLTAGRDAAARTRAAVVATLGASILSRLTSLDSRTLLRRELAEAATLLRNHGVTLVRDVAELRANGAALPARAISVWRDAMTTACLREIQFAQGTSERELMLFLALLHAPGDSAAFEAAWLASGAWRIHVVSETAASKDLADGSRAEEVEVVPVVGNTAALLRELAAANCGSRRRALFEAMLVQGADDAEIIAALSSEDWFLVRHAAALLGELRVLTADSAIAVLLRHHEPRVRVAAATALGQLDTPTGHAALTIAVVDPDESVRTHAWTAWTQCTVSPPAALLDAALRREESDQVQRALLDCAASFPELDVGGGLIRFCAREFTRRGPLEAVVAGVEQLALRRPDSAKAFVQRIAEQYGRAAAPSHAS